MSTEEYRDTRIQELVAQQAATNDILRAMSQSPDDLEVVFDVILDHALRLCHAQLGIVYLCEGDTFTATGLKGVPDAFQEYLLSGPIPAGPETGLGRMSKQRRVIHIEDVRGEDIYRKGDPLRIATADLGGARTFIAIPMIVQNDLIGAFTIYRREVAPFSSSEIAVIEAFSTQAAIAVANTRLIDQTRRQLETIHDQAEELRGINENLESRVKEQVDKLEHLGQLKRFLSPEVAEMIVSSDEDSPLRSHRRKIAALFCDLRGFTTFAEAVEPEEAIEVLQDYHQEMGKLIAEYGGTIDHRAGDGIMVFFNDPVTCERPASKAVAMAMSMRDRVNQLAESWRKQGWELGFGIGVSYGYATLGLVGDENRSDYTANGSVVNLASRLCDEARNNQILISQRVYAEVEDEVNAKSIGELSLKGISRNVHIWNIEPPA